MVQYYYQLGTQIAKLIYYSSRLKKKGKNSAGNDHTIFWTPEICQKST